MVIHCDFNDDDGKGFPELLIRIVAVSKSKPELLSTAVSKVQLDKQYPECIDLILEQISHRPTPTSLELP